MLSKKQIVNPIYKICDRTWEYFDLPSRQESGEQGSSSDLGC